ncbi:MAG: hypothetical protein ACRDRN_21005 [Sciscionella sp.]
MDTSPGSGAIMLRRGVLFAGLLLTAWTMALEFAHVLEWAPKAHYPGWLYARLQESLYVWFGNIGSVLEVLAVIVGVALAILARHDRASRGLLASAAGLEVIALIVFLTVVYPVNFQFPVHGFDAVPPDWAALRNRWELGHAVGFVLFTTAFILLLITALRPPTRHLTPQRADDAKPAPPLRQPESQ